MAVKLNAKGRRFAAWYTARALFSPRDTDGVVFETNFDGAAKEDLVVVGFDPSLSGPGSATLEGGRLVSRTSLSMKGTKMSFRERCVRIKHWAQGILNVSDPDLVVFEDLNSGRNFSGMAATASARGVIMSVIPEDVVFFDANISAVKSLLGSSTKKDREDGKAEMIELVEERFGVDLKENDDEADAIAVAYYGFAVSELLREIHNGFEEFDDKALLKHFKKYKDHEWKSPAGYIQGLDLLQDTNVGTYNKAVYRAKKVST